MGIDGLREPGMHWRRGGGEEFVIVAVDSGVSLLAFNAFSGSREIFLLLQVRHKLTKRQPAVAHGDIMLCLILFELVAGGGDGLVCVLFHQYQTSVKQLRLTTFCVPKALRIDHVAVPPPSSVAATSLA